MSDGAIVAVADGEERAVQGVVAEPTSRHHPAILFRDTEPTADAPKVGDNNQHPEEQHRPPRWTPQDPEHEADHDQETTEHSQPCLGAISNDRLPWMVAHSLYHDVLRGAGPTLWEAAAATVRPRGVESWAQA